MVLTLIEIFSKQLVVYVSLRCDRNYYASRDKSTVCQACLPVFLQSYLLVISTITAYIYLVMMCYPQSSLFIYFRVVNAGKLDSLCNTFPQNGRIIYWELLGHFYNSPALNYLHRPTLIRLNQNKRSTCVPHDKTRINYVVLLSFQQAG